MKVEQMLCMLCVLGGMNTSPRAATLGYSQALDYRYPGRGRRLLTSPLLVMARRLQDWRQRVLWLVRGRRGPSFPPVHSVSALQGRRRLPFPPRNGYLPHHGGGYGSLQAGILDAHGPFKGVSQESYSSRNAAIHNSYGSKKTEIQDSYGYPNEEKHNMYGSPNEETQDSYGSPNEKTRDSYGSPHTGIQDSYDSPQPDIQISFNYGYLQPEIQESYETPQAKTQISYGSPKAEIQESFPNAEIKGSYASSLTGTQGGIQDSHASPQREVEYIHRPLHLPTGPGINLLPGEVSVSALHVIESPPAANPGEFGERDGSFGESEEILGTPWSYPATTEPLSGLGIPLSDDSNTISEINHNEITVALNIVTRYLGEDTGTGGGSSVDQGPSHTLPGQDHLTKYLSTDPQHISKVTANPLYYQDIPKSTDYILGRKKEETYSPRIPG